MVSFIFKKNTPTPFFPDFVPENWDKLGHRISLTETDQHTASFFKIYKKRPLAGWYKLQYHQTIFSQSFYNTFFPVTVKLRVQWKKISSFQNCLSQIIWNNLVLN